MGSFAVVDKLQKVQHGMIIELDAEGKVLKTHHAVNTPFYRISCAQPYGDRLYLGSFAHDAIAYVRWQD
jgi:hypothetical protein